MAEIGGKLTSQPPSVELCNLIHYLDISPAVQDATSLVRRFGRTPYTEHIISSRIISLPEFDLWGRMTKEQAEEAGLYYRIRHNEDVGCIVRTKKLECLQWAIEDYPQMAVDYEWVSSAAFYGQIHMIEWMVDNDYDVSSALYHATRGGHETVVRWLLDNIECYVVSGVFSMVIAGRHDDILALLREHGNEPDTTALVRFLLPIQDADVVFVSLQWAHHHGFPWDERVAEGAAHYADIRLTRFLHDNGCPWDETATGTAAKHHDITLLQYMFENGCPWNEDTCYMASYASSLSSLTYAHENGCPWDDRVASMTAQYGLDDCLSFALDNGCPVDIMAMYNAAGHGCLSSLKLLHQHEAPFSTMSMNHAAENGMLECLAYLHKQGYEWDNGVLMSAVQHGHLECLAYIMDRGTLDKTDLLYHALIHGQFHVAKFLVSRGFTVDDAMFSNLRLMPHQEQVADFLLMFMRDSSEMSSDI